MDPYYPINPDKPKKARLIKAAAAKAIGIPLNAFGTLLASKR